MRNNRLSIESIDFQTDDFGLKIETILNKIKTHLDSQPTITRAELSKLDYNKELEVLVNYRLGINCDIIFNTTIPGAVIVFPVNRNHVLLKTMWRDAYKEKEQDKMLKTMGDKKGFIDLGKAKLSGVFSEYKHKLYVDILGGLKQGFDVPSLTAVILHELGHVFSYYELSDRLTSTNQVLADIALTTKEGADKGKRTYLFKELSDKLGTKSNEWDDIIEEDNKIIFGAKLFKRVVTSVKSQMDNAKYDETASEQLADNFAARFGYGRQLIKGLDILHRNDPERNNFAYYLFSSVDFLYTIVYRTAVIFYVIFAGLVPLAVILALVYAAIVLLTGASFSDMTYDDLKIRYTRIRNQSVARIKDLNLDHDELQDIVSGIYWMDGIINDTKTYSLIFTKISNWVFTVNRSAKESVEFQVMLEELTHNSLFIKSAELTLLK